MAESILTQITLASGAINIYYDTILASGYNSGNISIPNNWKVVVILSADNGSYHLFNPLIIFTTSSTWYEGLFFNGTNYGFWITAYVDTSNNLHMNYNSQYIVAA